MPKQFFSLDRTQKTLLCQGSWTLKSLMALKKSLNEIETSPQLLTVINGENIEQLDSAGALVLSQWMKTFSQGTSAVKLENFKTEHAKLIKLVSIDEKCFVVPRMPTINPLARLGVFAVNYYLGTQRFLAFIGESTLISFKLLLQFKRMPWRGIISAIELTGVFALPIIGLLSFLIGVVLTYQMGLQLRNYGANIYIVDLLGLSLLREFAPLMTAIIVAGRSGSAFTAQLGTMKIREEMDALRTMGLSPIELLIFPKQLGLVIVLPLLSVWASLFGILGGMWISHSMLNIGYADFLYRFYESIPLSAYFAGMLKAPVFGFIIAAIACYQGLQVTGSAASVGERTTTSVVQSIFFIIVIDAAFSVLFKWFNI